MLSHSSARVFFARNDKVDAAVAAEALNKTADQEGVNYLGSVKVTDADWHAAHAVGMARTAIALARGRTQAKYRRGAAEDQRIDTEGALGELLAASLLGKAEEVVIAPLVEWRPSADSIDLQVTGSSYDVKAVSASKRRVCINRASHILRRPRAYVLVHLVAECVADLYLVAGSTVDTWQVFKGYDPYFAGQLPEPLPLETEDAE